MILNRSIRHVQLAKPFRVVLARAVLGHLAYSWLCAEDVDPCLRTVEAELVWRNADDGAIFFVKLCDILYYVTLHGREYRREIGCAPGLWTWKAGERVKEGVVEKTSYVQKEDLEEVDVSMAARGH